MSSLRRSRAPPGDGRLGFPDGPRVHAFESGLRRRKRALLDRAGIRFDAGEDLGIDGGELRRGRLARSREGAGVALERIAGRPFLDLPGWNVGLSVVLRVPLHAVRLRLEERRAIPGAGAIDGTARGCVDGEHVIAVDGLS